MRKNEKVVITIRGIVFDLIDEMMESDYQDNLSDFINSVIVSEKKRRDDEKAKRPVGRPKKGEEEEEEANIPHPDQLMNTGRMLTRSEFDEFAEVKGWGDREVQEHLRKHSIKW